LEQRAQQVDNSYRQLKHPARQLGQQREQTYSLAKKLYKAHIAIQQRKILVSNTIQQRLRSNSPKRQLSNVKNQLSNLTRRLEVAQTSHIKGKRNALISGAEKLELVSPLAVLARGYAVASKTSSGSILYNSEEAELGEAINVKLGRGELTCSIDEIHAPDANE
jgi:exodeoxyribonuclease VII large subunit